MKKKIIWTLGKFNRFKLGTTPFFKSLSWHYLKTLQRISRIAKRCLTKSNSNGYSLTLSQMRSVMTKTRIQHQHVKNTHAILCQRTTHCMQDNLVRYERGKEVFWRYSDRVSHFTCFCKWGSAENAKRYITYQWVLRRPQPQIKPTQYVL